MFINVLYTMLLISIVFFLVSGMLTILQFTGYFKKHPLRYVKYFIVFTVIMIILMGVLVIVGLDG
ncbi:hypothetical protein [Salinicoccus sp. YB14-2]|uniref:hypothetical protein n=1 Tax=Salinicoccus sp. YB14-2 TaxID=1572701 RepID=UPI00068B1CCE|nr:hypothetical protein [Salinicoccus sp. YB14-2]